MKKKIIQMQINDCFKRENFKMKKDIRNLVTFRTKQ